MGQLTVANLVYYGPAFALLLIIGLAVNAYLYFYYRGVLRSAIDQPWIARWTVTPETIGGFSYWRLALVSALGLFLELLMIRWISSEIRMFAYFKNFVLIACFLGFGLGCYLCRRRINIFITVLPLLTLDLLVQIPWKAFRELVGHLPSFLGVFSETTFWNVATHPVSTFTVLGVGAAIAVVVLVFGLITFMFIPIGQLVGWYLENARNGISGYTVNILASLAGILIYTLLCFVYQPPAVWLSLAGLMLVVLLWRVRWLRFATLSAFVICVGLSLIRADQNTTVYWSPYQRLGVSPVVAGGETIAYDLNTNGDWYQKIFNLSPGFVAQHPELFKDVSAEWNAYNLPYHFYPHPNSVLVLGAGTGNDVAAALRNGAGRVVAVEIDPLIFQLGQRLHFEKPYDSPRVTRVLDDARSYLQNGDEQFDFIMFSLLDSHTTSSHFTNIRIDNYVYTTEALQAARRHLKPDGVMVVKFWVSTPWIAGRLYGLLDTTFGQAPVAVGAEQPIYATSGTFFVSGSQDRIAKSLAEPDLAHYVETHPPGAMQKVTLTTDDWPYFYQREPGLPATVTMISGVLILLCWLFMRQTGINAGTLHWHLFFLGAGFLLLEAQIVSKMALLFGTTWAVNAIVIAGLLLLIVGSNILVEYFPHIPLGIAYGGIFASILLSYTIPLESFFFRSFVLKLVAATLVLCLPVFFAGIVFIQGFAQEGFSGEALGSNLLGALVGGLLESLSYWWGIRSLLILAALLYLLSWAALRVREPAHDTLVRARAD